MASTIEAQAFQFEMRPETSKCQRGAQNKFNKTLTGFHSNNNESQSLQTQGYQNAMGYNDNLMQQKGMMNITGFNFRQNKHQDQKNSEQNYQQKTPKQSIVIQQNQQFSSTSQGFYQNKRQNSFSKGITLEQYFQNAKDYEQLPQEEGNNQGNQLANQKVTEGNNAPSRSKFPQSFQLSDIKIIDDDLQDKNNLRQKSEKFDIQASKRNSQTNFEKKNLEYSDMVEEQYDTDEFEIHEESDEEEEEDDEENKKRKKKRLAGQMNLSSSKKQVKKEGDSKNSRANAKSPQLSGEKQQKQDASSFQNENQDPSSAAYDLEDFDANDNKNQRKVLKQKYSLKPEEQNKQQKENDINQQNKSAQKLGSSENIKISISNEDQIQKKIRDKYFKKTLHKPFVTQQIVQNSQTSKKASSSNPHSLQNTSIASTVGSSNSTSNNNSLLFSNQQISQNQSQIVGTSNNIKVNSPANQGGQHQTNPNFISTNINANGNNPNIQQQGGYNCISNMSSIHTKITAQYQPSSTGHNFYSQNHQNINGNNGLPPNCNSNSPNTYLYAAANTTNRKANRSQSPLHTFKRQSNLGHSQQRRLSKEIAESNSPSEENPIMRTTFNNTTKKFKIQQPNSNNILNNYEASNGASSFENHIAFRNSFYNKGPPPLNSLPNSNYVSAANSQNNNNNSKQRLTINDFYKNQSKYDCYDQPIRNGGFNSQNSGDYIADVMMMRRTAKENKFLNQKDKIQEMVKEDVNYITKHAARFNINPSELVQIKQKN
ncbi:hypothetical protein ABPG72_011236 [Tetrahymena utriculariae]